MSLGHQGLPLIGPFERFGHGSVIIVDESQYLDLQLINGSERATFE